MDSCPPEIHAIIFSHACADGGKTGIALSSVSRYIRMISMSYQWHSVTITGSLQAWKFSETLKRVDVDDPRARPIRHLLLTDYGMSSLILHEQWRAHQGRILRYAAPTLKTFSLYLVEPYPRTVLYVAAALSVNLPVLEDLAIYAGFTPLQLVHAAHNAISDPSFPSAFIVRHDDALIRLDILGEGSVVMCDLTHPRPRLRRLHLACLYTGSTYETGAIRDVLMLISPVLTHLRITAIYPVGPAESVAQFLRSLFASWVAREYPPTSISATDGSWLHLLPKSLECLLTGYSLTHDERFSHFPYFVKNKLEFERLKMDWLERMQGGRGCWEERPFSETVTDMERAVENHRLRRLVDSVTPASVMPDSRLRRFLRKIKCW